MGIDKRDSGRIPSYRSRALLISYGEKMPDYRKTLKHVEPKKREVKIPEEEKKLLEQFSGTDEIPLSSEQRTVLDILSKRKTVSMITREYNLALKPLGGELVTEDEIIEILRALESMNLVKSVVGADNEEYWVDINYYTEKLFGTDKL